MEITLHEFVETMQWAFIAGASIAIGFQVGSGICRLTASVIRRSKR